MTDDSQIPARTRLKEMRERAALSLGELAELLGRRKSSYQYYEDDYKREFLPLDVVKALVPIFAARGIDEAEVLALSGLSPASKATLKPAKSRAVKETSMANIEEVDVRAAQGAGSFDDVEEVVAEWRLPRELIRVATHATPDCIKIITLVGDSMPRSFRPYEKVAVDTSDVRPSPPGIFIVWDGLGLVAKRVEHIAHSDPPTVRITSENPDYQPYERTLEEAHIRGRVLGRWQWV